MASSGALHRLKIGWPEGSGAGTKRCDGLLLFGRVSLESPKYPHPDSLTSNPTQPIVLVLVLATTNHRRANPSTRKALDKRVVLARAPESTLAMRYSTQIRKNACQTIATKLTSSFFSAQGPLISSVSVNMYPISVAGGVSESD